MLDEATLDALLADAAAAEGDAAPAALAALCDALLPTTTGEDVSTLLDERSFDIFDAAFSRAHASVACATHAERLALALAETASAREVYCMVMDAFSSYASPATQLLLLRTLARVLPCLQRKRADFLSECLGTLRKRFLRAWPGDEWEDEDDDLQIAPSAHGDDGPPSTRSQQLVAALLECVCPLTHEATVAAGAGEAEVSSAVVRMRRELLIFLWRMLELVDAHKLTAPPADPRGSEQLGRTSGDARALLLHFITESSPTLSEMMEEAARPPSDGQSRAASASAVPGRGPSPSASDSAEPSPSARDGFDESSSAVVGLGVYVSAHVTCRSGPVGSGRQRDARGDGPADDVSSGAPTSVADSAAGGSRLPAWQAALDGLDGRAQLPLLARLATHLLRRPAHAPMGHTLLAAAVQAVPKAALGICAPSDNEASAGGVAVGAADGATADGADGTTAYGADDADEADDAAAGAARALLAHMANHGEQRERTAAYGTLQALLWRWCAPARLRLLRTLLRTCPFPNVVALLVHRVKEEHLAEARRLAEEHQPAEACAKHNVAGESAAVTDATAPPAPESAAGAAAAAEGIPAAAVFSASAAVDLVEPLLTIADRSHPLDALDALMGAVNLLRLLLMRAHSAAAMATEALRGHAALSDGRCRALRHERLQPLDAWVRRHMDCLWAEIAAAEAASADAAQLGEMRMDFTRLQTLAVTLPLLLEPA